MLNFLKGDLFMAYVKGTGIQELAFRMVNGDTTSKNKLINYYFKQFL